MKRCLVKDTDKKTVIITDNENSFLEVVSTDHHTVIDISFAKPRGKEAKENEMLNLLDFIAVKGMKALGNKLSYEKIKTVDRIIGEQAAEFLKIELEELEKDYYPEPLEEKSEEAADSDDSADDNDDAKGAELESKKEEPKEQKAEESPALAKDIDTPSDIPLEIEEPKKESEVNPPKAETEKPKPAPKKTNKKDPPDTPSLFDDLF